MKQNKEIIEFVKKIEPEFVELIQQKLVDSHKNIEVFDPAQLTYDTTQKMREWFDMIAKNKVGSQLEIEVLVAISARIMLLWYVREKCKECVPVINTEMV